MGVEGVSAGTVTLSLVIKAGAGAELCRDEVLLTVIDLDARWYTWVHGVPGVEIVDPHARHRNEPLSPPSATLFKRRLEDGYANVRAAIRLADRRWIAQIAQHIV